jgi:hypothetical protein
MSRLPDITQSALFMEAAAEARQESRRYWARKDAENMPAIIPRREGVALNLTAREMARALGGHVVGRDTVACPGPGHRRHDRSLQVKLVAGAQGGFVVHSFAGDDWTTCRDHVRHCLGLPEWEAERRGAA